MSMKKSEAIAYVVIALAIIIVGVAVGKVFILDVFHLGEFCPEAVFIHMQDRIQKRIIRVRLSTLKEYITETIMHSSVGPQSPGSPVSTEIVSTSDGSDMDELPAHLQDASQDPEECIGPVAAANRDAADTAMYFYAVPDPLYYNAMP